MNTRVLSGIALLVGCAQALGQDVLPTWTVDKSTASILWHDTKLAVLVYADKLEGLDLARGATLWTVPHAKKPEQMGACADVVCVRNGGKVQGYDPRSGKPSFALDQIGGMAVLGGKLYCTDAKGAIRQYAPPGTQSAVVKIEVPYQAFVDLKKGLHLGNFVVWRSSPEFISCYDFEQATLAWKSSLGAYKYTKTKSNAASDGRATFEDAVIMDELFGFYPHADYVALHMSHVMVHGSKDSKEVKAEYLWTLELDKGGAGMKQSLQRVDTDKPGVPLVHWTAGVPKPWLVARYEHVAQPGQYRFDVYPGGGSINVRSGYLPFERVAPGAKGQLVAWKIPTTAVPAAFDVLGATSATRALWRATGRVLPRLDDKEPYLVLAYDDQAKTSRLRRLDPASGAELVGLDLGAGEWDVVPGTAHLLLRGPSGRLVRVDRAALTISHRYDFASGVTQALPLGADEVLIRAGGKLARASFKAAPPAK